MAGQVAARASIDPPNLAQLYLGFAQISVSAFGGALPWARRVLVEDRGWLEPDDFTDTLALCQFLPGPNVINLSIAVGSRFHGAAGALCAFLGLMGAPVVLVIGLGLLYSRYGQLDALRAMFAALGAAAAGLVVATAAKMAVPIIRKQPLAGPPVMIGGFVMVGLLGWPLPLVLAILAPISIVLAWRPRR
ncbi:MAG TPA: chromate transporter [Caulobacteraceae bacterium]|jgi:chromate transporter|nr:chromate transporter [Caulobacteraceae bacterium]